MNLPKTLVLLPLLAQCVSCDSGAFQDYGPQALDALPNTYEVRVFEAQNTDGRFAVQLFVSDALVGEIGRGHSNYYFANSRRVLCKNASKEDVRVLRESLLALMAQTKAMLVGHAYREGPPRTAKNIVRVTTCTVNVLYGSMVFNSNVSFSENPLHREYTSQPIEERDGQQTLEICRRLTEIMIPDLAFMAPDKAVAPVIKRGVTPVNDGKVMLSCSARNFYPSEISMGFVAPQGLRFLELKGDPMPVFGRKAEDADRVGKYSRTDFLFVEADLARNVTCVVHHAGMAEPYVVDYPTSAVAPLSPRESSGSPMPAYNLMQFVKTRDPRYVAGPAHIECLDREPTAEYPFTCLE